MKTLAQRRTRKRRASSPPEGTTVLRPRLPGGNHVRVAVDDHFEAQAERAAEHIIRGHQDLAAHLSPTPAASFTISTSRGRPLHRALRDDLEAGFGADLQAVRIHTDNPAHTATTQYEAEAMTAGRDIYFAAGAYDPDSESGWRLLLHEVAHVLQQTGRRGSDGRLHATDLYGGGPVQRQSLLEIYRDMLHWIDFAEAVPSLDDIIARHKADAEEKRDTKLVALIEMESAAIKAELGEIQKAHPGASAFVARVAAMTFSRDEITALYYDVLKGLGEHRAALKLPRSTPSHTAFMSNEHYTTALESDLSWLPDEMNDVYIEGTHWLERVVDTYRIYLFGLERPVQSLAYHQSTTKLFENLLNQFRAPDKLVPNERRLFAWLALDNFDSVRIQVLDDLRNELLTPVAPTTAGDTPKPLVVDQRQLNQAMAQELAAEGWIESWIGLYAPLAPAAQRLVEIAAPEIRKVAAEAARFWQEMAFKDLLVAAVDEQTFADLGSASELLAKIGAAPEFSQLEAELLVIAKLLFRLVRGDMPSASSYIGTLKTVSASLVELARRYDLPLIKLRREAEPGVARTELEMYYGLVQALITWIRLAVDTFQRYLEDNLADAKSQEFQDQYVAIRLSLARAVYRVGQFMGLADLEAFTLSVLTGTQKGQTQSFVALLGTWEQDTDADMDTFREDFPGLEIAGTGAPLLGADLINFAFATYYGALADNIRHLLTTRGTDFTPGQEPIINEAQRLDEAAFEEPRRYVMDPTEFEASVIPDDRPYFHRFFTAHPRFTAFRDKVIADSKGTAEVYYQLHYGAHVGGIVLWVLPGLDKLVNILVKNVPGLDAAVKAQAATETLTAVEWLEALNQLVSDPEQWEQWAQLVRDAVSADYQGALEELDIQTRLASNHQRHVVFNVVNEYWTEYDSTEIATFTLPLKAIERMIEFAQRAEPPTDQQFQMAALMLELGPLMYSRLGPQDVVFGALKTSGTERFDIIALLLPHLVGTLMLLGDASRNATLQGQFDLILPQGYSVHEDALSELKSQTEARAREYQTERALQGNKDNNSLLVPGRGYPLLAGPERTVKIDGRDYELVKVHETFSYHPDVSIPAGGISWPDEKLGDSILKDANGTEIPLAQRTGKLLVEFKRDGKLIKVKDNDDRVLSELTHVVFMQAVVRQLEDLAAVMEAAAEFALDVAEFIPGVGPAIMVARLAANILAFVASDEFQEIQEALGGDSAELYRKALEKLMVVFDPDVLWNWLLFGQGGIPFIGPVEESERQKHTTRSFGKRARLKKRLQVIIGALRSVGTKVGMAFERLHDRFTVPMRRTRLFVQTRPLLAMVLALMVENFDRLAALTEDALDVGAKAAEFTARLNEFSQKISDLLQLLEDLELPAEVIPLDQIVDLTLDLVTDKLGGKYKLAVATVKEGLIAIGAWDRVVDAITGQLKDAGMDPNIIWRETVRAELQPVVQQVGQDFAELAGDLLSRVPIFPDFNRPQMPDIALKTDDQEAPEVQPYFDPAARAFTGVMPRVLDAGTSLEGSLRREAERNLGHDLGHVRLHTGPAASMVTGALGARGVASGSHIFLDRHLAPGHGQGAQVFHHELAHVLQQTGPRPLGGTYSAQPVTGHAGAGLRYNRAQERAAEWVARRSLHGPAQWPLDVGPRGPFAPQPDLAGILKKFFEQLSDVEKLTSFVERVDTGKPEKSKLDPDYAKLDAHARRVRKVLPEKLVTEIGTLGPDDFDDPLKSVYDEIKKYIRDNHLKAIEAAIKPLSRVAMQDKPASRRTHPPGTTTPSEPEKEFDPDRFELALEEYLFGKTGVFFNVEFYTVERDGAKEIDLSRIDPLKKFHAEHIHLPFLGGAAGLWETVITNTYVNNTPVTFRTKYGTLGTDAKATYQGKARLVLRALGPRPNIFWPSEFRFSDSVARLIEDEVFPPPGGAMPADILPPVADYLSETKKMAVNFTPNYGNISIRYGRYNQNKKPGDQYGHSRDAHHTTQYLLLEYFRNVKPMPYRPFHHPITHYPGVTGTRSGINAITDGTNTINIAGFFPGRGGKMPTILISRFAHRYADLHVHGLSADDTETASSSPGDRVHGWFENHLGADYAAIMFDSSAQKLQTVKDQTAGETVKPADEVRVGSKLVKSDMLRTQIFSAACKTYTQMRDEMQQKLRDNLPAKEIEFYTDVAKRSPNAKKPGTTTGELKREYTMTKTDLGPILAKAPTHNNAIMEGLIGFKEMT